MDGTDDEPDDQTEYDDSGDRGHIRILEERVVDRKTQTWLVGDESIGTPELSNVGCPHGVGVAVAA